MMTQGDKVVYIAETSIVTQFIKGHMYTFYKNSTSIAGVRGILVEEDASWIMAKLEYICVTEALNRKLL
jgi:hypothetical protein